MTKEEKVLSAKRADSQGWPTPWNVEEKQWTCESFGHDTSYISGFSAWHSFFIRLYLKQVLLRKTPQSSVQSCIPIIDVNPLSRRYAQPWYEEVFFLCFFPTLEWILALPWTNVNNIDGDMPRNHAVLRCSASNQGLSRLYGAPCPVKPWCPTLHLLWPPGQTSEAGASGVSVHRKIHHHPEEDSDTDHPGTQ